VTPEEEAVVGLVRLLERLGIPHMVSGSVASSYHGRPRLTHDADVVVDPTAGQLEELVSSLLAEGHYVDAARAQDALRGRLQFNVVDARSAFKIDLIVRKERPFSREGLRRAVGGRARRFGPLARDLGRYAGLTRWFSGERIAGTQLLEQGEVAVAREQLFDAVGHAQRRHPLVMDDPASHARPVQEAGEGVDRQHRESAAAVDLVRGGPASSSPRAGQ
jgi:hypothetical protein